MDEHAQWVARRRAGERASDIARAAGVSHQWVSRVTAPHGPFPRHPPLAQADIHRWIRDRAQGMSPATIARRDDVDPKTVTRATKDHGPFPRGHPKRLTSDLLGVTAMAELLGVAGPTVLRWEGRGLLPSPDHVTASGRRQWRPETVTTWLRHADLEVCDLCGAGALSGSHRRRAVHRS